MKRIGRVTLVAVIGLIIIAGADRYFRAESEEMDRIALQLALEHTADRLEDDLRNGIAAVESLAGFMQVSATRPGMKQFDEFAAFLLARHPSVRSLAYVDSKSVIRHFYPQRGNESAIGLDLKRRPAAPFVARAIRERRTTVNHPTRTVQGSLAVIARTPYYREGKLAGLVQAVFDLSQIVPAAVVLLDERIGYTLRDANGKYIQGIDSQHVNPLTATVKVGDNHWQLSVSWLNGPPGPVPALLGLLWVGGFLLLASLVILIWRTQAREQWLSSAVEEKTKALHDREKLLNHVLDALPVGVWVADKDGNLILGNPEGQKIWAGARFVGVEQYGEYKGWWVDTGKPIAADEWALARAIQKGETVYNEVIDIECFDGTHKTILNSAVPIRANGNEITGAIVVNQDITARKRAERTLRESESKYRQLFENMTSGFALHEIICDAQGKPVDYRYLQANPAFERLTGVPIADIVGKRIREILPNTEDYWIDIFGKVALTGEPMAYENYSRELGKYFDTWVFCPEPNQFAVIFTDITKRKVVEAEMAKLSSALEQTADTVMITNLDGVIEYVNLGFEQATGYTRDEAVGQTPGLLKSGKQGPAFYKKLWETILAGEVFSEVFVNRRKDGSLYYEEKTISPLKDTAGRATHFVATGKDVSERMRAQEQLQHMAQHDALTELPNRLLFMDRLKQALARARWHERLVGVLFIDMDRFKNINDTLGHEIGDQVLQALAGRFASGVREGDTVARFGGDEFVILLDDVASEKDIGMIAQKVLEALAPPFVIDHQNLYVTASIGISLYPNDGEDSGTLLRNADIAMYRAKELGKNTYQFYSADMSARAFERLTLESSLRHAIERKEFRLYYQPQIDTTSGVILGVEALLRWQHPDFGLVAPTEFIPLLEETGLIVPVGDWVFNTACEQLCAWHAAGWPTLRMAVNLSPRQFQGVGLAIMVERGLAAVGCDPGLIELEITENVLLRHAATTLETLDALREIGVRLAIDDFGTGYSSLSYLRRYSIDTLKVDRSFVHDLPGDADDCALATAIIVLAQSLKLDVIAEGVETEAQRDFLRERGCHQMQGYLFSRPVPAEDIPPLLEARNPKR